MFANLDDRGTRIKDSSKQWYEDVGIGLHILSSTAIWAGRHFHAILAAVTCLIVLTTVPLHGHWPVVLAALLIYSIYLLTVRRWRRLTEAKIWFYRQEVQLVRVHFGLVATTVLIYLTEAEHSVLFVLYGLAILMAVRNLERPTYLIIAAESSVLIVLIRLTRLLVTANSETSLVVWAQVNADVVQQILVLGLLAFLCHYMTRRVIALQETLAGFGAINSLADRIVSESHGSASQWRPVLEAIISHMPVEEATLWLFDPAAEQLHIKARLVLGNAKNDEAIFSDGTDQPVLQLQSSEPSLITSVVRSGQPQFGDLQRHKLDIVFLRRLLIGRWRHENEPLAELAYPIIVKGITLSVIHLRFRPQRFIAELQNDYLDFLQRLENLVKPMLVYASLLDKTETLHAITELMHSSLDQNTVIDRALTLIVKRLGFEFVTISLVDAQRDEIYCVRGLNVPDEWVMAARHPLSSNDIQADVVRTRTPQVIAAYDSRLDTQIYARFGHQSLVRVFMPLIVFDPNKGTDVVIGTIEAGHRRSNRDSIHRDQMDMLSEVVKQVAIAISHWQLIYEVSEKAKALESKAEALAKLHQLGQKLSKAQDLNQLLTQLVTDARQLLSADLVMLYQYDKDKQGMQIPVIVGDDIRHSDLRLKLTNDNLLGQLAERSEPLYYCSDDISAGNEMVITSLAAYIGNVTGGKSKHRTFMERHKICAFAALPLVVDGERVGLLVVNYRKPHDFNEAVRLLHELFAQNASVVIWNALTREREHTNLIRQERSDLSRELHDSVKQSLATIALQSYAIQQQLSPDCAVVLNQLEKIEIVARTASNETAFIMAELRAPDHELQQFVRGLQAYVERVQRWYDSFEICFEHSGLLQLPDIVERKALRFVREAINNAIRHSRGSKILVRSQATDAELTLTVSDNGVGFDESKVSPNRLGLQGMRELTQEMNGLTWIHRMPEGGTTVWLTVPLDFVHNQRAIHIVPDWLHQQFVSGGVNPWTLL